MAKTTRENLKKYKRLYYIKPKKKSSRLKSGLVVFLIWQLVVWQIVFAFNLKISTAADSGTETVTSSADSSSADSANDSDAKKDDKDNSKNEKERAGGKSDAAKKEERAKSRDENSGKNDKKGKNSETKANEDSDLSVPKDEKKEEVSSESEKKDSNAQIKPADSPERNAKNEESGEKEQAIADVSSEEYMPTVADADGEKINDAGEFNKASANPKDFWKTCDLDSVLGKISGEKERDRCKKKTTCAKIESCLQAIIKIENDTDIESDVETTASTGENKIDVDQPVPSRDRMAQTEQVQADSAETAVAAAMEAQVDAAGDNNIEENIVDSNSGDANIADGANAADQSERDSGTDRVREERSVASADVEDFPESGSAEIATGDAAAVSVTVNEVNTNIIGRNGIETVENIYGDYAGDINLLDTFNSLLENGKNLNEENQSVLGVMEISIENEADVDNDVTTVADTGQNEIDNESESASGDSAIETGDAVAAADVVNIVNTNIIGENFLFAVVNVFGRWTGDLIVPGAGLLTMPAAAQAINAIVDVQNETTIENDISTNAETGKNLVENENGASSVQTGEAIADSTVVNQIGTTVVADNWFFLTINNMGSWVGNVLNWDEESGGYDNVFSFDFDEDDDPQGEGLAGWITKIFIKNDANVENDIETTANTGENEIENEGGNASIKTGNASAFSKVYNLVNNNFIGRNWMFAVVNIFGSWQGNVNFVRPEVPAVPPDGSENEASPPETPGGSIIIQPETAGNTDSLGTEGEAVAVKILNPSLALSRSVSEQEINVGEIAKHTLVLENTGDSAIHDIVISDSVSNKKGGAGTYSWNVAKIDPGRKVTVEYKLLINSNAPAGKYKNTASALGYDENDSEVRSNEAGAQIAVGEADLTVASAEAASYDYYTYYTYYYYRKGVVPVESNVAFSQPAEAAEPDGNVLGESNTLWSRPAEPGNFNPAWIVLPAALLLATHLRRKRGKKIN